MTGDNPEVEVVGELFFLKVIFLIKNFYYIFLPIKLFGSEAVVRGPEVAVLTAIDEYGSWIFSESKFEFIPEPPLGTLTTLESAEIVPSLVLVLTVIKIGGSSAKSASLSNTWSAKDDN